MIDYSPLWKTMEEKKVSQYTILKKGVDNKTLNRLFINNLKENGVIEICPPLHIESRLSIGNISTIVPCIHPYINIIEKGEV